MNKHLQIVALSALMLDLSDVEWVWNGDTFVNSNNPNDTLSFDEASATVAGTIIDLQNAGAQ